MADFALSSDVEEAWRTLTSDETIVADTQLRFASAIIRNEVPGIDDRITAGTLDPDLVLGVAVAMVLRMMKNPDGKAQEAIEDYSYRRDTALASGSLYMSDAELALLRGRRRGAFSIAPVMPTVAPCEVERVRARSDAVAWASVRRRSDFRVDL